MNLKIHYHIHKSPSSVLILRQSSPVYSFTFYYFGTSCNIVLPSMPKSSKWFLPSVFNENESKLNYSTTFSGNSSTKFHRTRSAVSDVALAEGVTCRSQWPRSLTHKLSSSAPTLGSWVRIPLKAWMSVCVYFVFVLLCL
jgi:hypothetical protein